MIDATRAGELKRITRCLSVRRPAGCRGADGADVSGTQESPLLRSLQPVQPLGGLDSTHPASLKRTAGGDLP